MYSESIFALIFQQEESGVSLPGSNGQQLLTLGLGLLATALAASYVTKLAKVIGLHFRNTRNSEDIARCHWLGFS